MEQRGLFYASFEGWDKMSSMVGGVVCAWQPYHTLEHNLMDCIPPFLFQQVLVSSQLDSGGLLYFPLTFQRRHGGS